MRPLGDRKMKSGEGHQDCGICHPEVKNRKAKERRRAEKRIMDEAADRQALGLENRGAGEIP